MIEYRPLTRAEEQSDTHFCGRCETWQKRYELHHCIGTERYKAAKAKGEVVHPSLKTPEPIRKKKAQRLPAPDGVKLLPPPAKPTKPAKAKKASVTQASPSVAPPCQSKALGSSGRLKGNVLP